MDVSGFTTLLPSARESGMGDQSNPGVIGIDVGGANLKYAATSGGSLSRFFPMWQKSEQLADVIAEDLVSRFSQTAIKHLAVTMTGELADCFIDRDQGVRHIVSHTRKAAERLAIEDVSFYGVNGIFHGPDAACDAVDTVAAANWHALAQWVATEICANATLIDIGSTTTDIIPVSDGRVATAAQTDFDRLSDGSLVYVGCRRTPVCSVVSQLLVHENEVPIMREHFATMDDVMLLLNHTPEYADDCDSADGKPRTQEFAANRLSRMVGLDRRSVSIAEAKLLAAQVLDAARRVVHEGVQRIGLSSKIVLSGHGGTLVEVPAGVEVISLVTRLGSDLARSAPAYAVAALRSQECEDASSKQTQDRILGGK